MKELNEKRMDELNEKCKKCIAEAEKNFETVDRQKCAHFCPVGREIHKLEEQSSSKWNEVDWNSSRYKEFYHR